MNFIKHIISAFNPLSVSKYENSYDIVFDDTSIIKIEVDEVESSKSEIISLIGSKSEAFQKYFYSYTPSDNHVLYLDELYSEIGDSDIFNDNADGTKLILINNISGGLIIEELMYNILFGYKKVIENTIETFIITDGLPLNNNTGLDDFGPYIYKIINNKVVYWDGWINKDFYFKIKGLSENTSYIITEEFIDITYIKLTPDEISNLTFKRAFLQ